MKYRDSSERRRGINMRKLVLVVVVVGVALLVGLFIVAAIIIAIIGAILGQADLNIGTVVQTLLGYVQSIIDALVKQFTADPLKFLMNEGN